MKQAGVTLSLLLILAALQWLFGRYLNPYYLQILILVGIQAILAQSLNLIHGQTGLFSLGHAGFMAIGAYAAAAFSVYANPKILTYLHWIPVTGAEALLFVLALLSGTFAAGLASLIVGIPVLRLKGDYLAIATLGFSEIVLVAINNTQAIGGARGFSDIPEYSNFFSVFAGALLALWILHRMSHAAKGKSFVAIRENEIAATSLGIDASRTKILAFVTGSAIAGFGGGLFAHFFTYLHVNSFGFLKSVEFVAMVVLGAGRFWTVLAATTLLTVLPETLRGFASLRMIVYSLLIIGSMLLRAKAWNFKSLRRRAENPQT